MRVRIRVRYPVQTFVNDVQSLNKLRKLFLIREIARVRSK